MKIIQIMGMPNDPCWQGNVLGLGDDGVLYVSHNTMGWEVYIPANIVKNGIIQRCSK